MKMNAILDWLFHAKAGKIVSTFIAFTIFQLTFAAVYFYLYKEKRDNFVFNADILISQNAATRISSERKLTKLQGALEALREATKELDGGAAPVVNNRSNATLALPSGRTCVMVFLSGPRGPAGSLLTITDSNGQELLDVDPTEFSFSGWLNSAAWLSTRADWQAVIPRIIKQLESKKQDEVDRLESLTTTRPDVWSYWDFLYFSTITQTTVGFGDILPNSTLIRMLVVFHILIGYALLIVVLNIILNS